MGCCSSSAANGPDVSTDIASKNASSEPEQSVANPVQASTPKVVSSVTEQGKTILMHSGTPKAATAAQGAQAAPAPGVKHVRNAYSGKGWAPPQKEWDSTKKEKGDKTKIEIEDEWDDDGNLKRTITKRITTPDWKFKTEKTVELIPAEEAAKLGLGRK